MYMKQDITTLYIKEGNRYKEYGVSFNRNHLSNGIWYVKHHESRHSHTNAAYITQLTGLVKVGECPDRLDITRALQQHDLAESILEDKRFNELVSKPYTLNELVHKVINIIAEKNEKL